MTNPKQAQRPICQEPGCGLPKKALRLLGIPVYWVCPRTDEEHRLRAQLAELMVAKRTDLARYRERLHHIEAQLSEATAALVTLREALADHVCTGECFVCEALSTTSHATSAAVERIRAEQREKCVRAFKGMVTLWQDGSDVTEEEIRSSLNRAEGEKL